MEKFFIKVYMKIKNLNPRKYELINKDFTIVSNNCFGGFIYQKLNLQYKSPFIGLFILGPDYIELLENFCELINLDMIFINPKDSKYKDYLIKMNRYDKYPIGKLGDNVEIHFLHYKNEKEALNSWNKRLKRVNFDNILFKFSDGDLSDSSLIERFDKLKFKNKICFVSKKYPEYKCTYYLKMLKNKPHVLDEWSHISRYEIVKILNNMV